MLTKGVPARLAGGAHLGLIGVLLIPGAIRAQLAPTQAQSVASGARVYGAKGCNACHAVNGVGARVGPDLGRSLVVASVNELVAALWNHLPEMAARMRTIPTSPPRMAPWEAADLVAFLFWSGYSASRGSPAMGEALFTTKRCVVCHQIGGVGGVVGPRLDGLGARSPIDVAATFWNHAPGMEFEMRARGLARPTLTGPELNDLLAFLGSGGATAEVDRVNVLPGEASTGGALFRSKGCLRCHRVGAEGGQVGPDLGSLPRRDPVGLAAAMWNKSGKMADAMRRAGITPPELSGTEMADLVAYLGTLQYLAGEGSAARGEERLSSAGCLRCHSFRGEGAKRAGDLAGRVGLTTRAAVLAALWNHVALPDSLLNDAWPLLRPDAIADLVAYFEMQGRGR